MERSLRSQPLTEAASAESPLDRWAPIRLVLASHPELLLDATDFLLHSARKAGGRPNRDAAELEAVLDQGGSVYSVAEQGDAYRLERRVDPAVRAAVNEAIGHQDRAAAHLANAWGLLYGRAPSSSEGYREAVKAVEAAMKPIVLPKDRVATLGKMLTAMRDAPAKWEMVLGPDGSGSSVEVVADMAGMVWRSQHDRHGTDDTSVPESVSLEEARAALHLCVTLVQWCRSGALRRR